MAFDATAVAPTRTPSFTCNQHRHFLNDHRRICCLRSLKSPSPMLRVARDFFSRCSGPDQATTIQRDVFRLVPWAAEQVLNDGVVD